MSKWLDIHKDFWTISRNKMTKYSQKISSVKNFQYSQIAYIKSITQ